MKRKIFIPYRPRLFFLISAFLTLLLTSCSSSQLVSTWYDKGFVDQNKLQDVLVIAIAKDETIKRLYEDLFVARFEKSGVRAIPSYTLSQPDIKPEKEAIDAAVREAGAGAVLVTRHLGTDTKEHYRPPQRTVYADPVYSGFYGYYPMAYREVYTPGYTYTVTTVCLEASLYHVDGGKLIWSARSESIDPSMTEKYIQSLVDLFADDLKAKGILL